MVQQFAIKLWDKRAALISLNEPYAHIGARLIVSNEVAKRLIYEHYFKEYGIPTQPTEEALATIIENFRLQNKLTDGALWDLFLQKNQTNEKHLALATFYANLVEQLKEKVVTKQQINEAFLKRKANLDKICFGVIRVSTQSQAQELYYRLTHDGEDFMNLATQYSHGQERVNGGLFPPQPIRLINPDILKELSKIHPGETSKPFTFNGKEYLIVRFLFVEKAQRTPALEKEIKDELFDQWTSRQIKLANLSFDDVSNEYVPFSAFDTPESMKILAGYMSQNSFVPETTGSDVTPNPRTA